MRWSLTAFALLGGMPAAAQPAIMDGRIGTAIVSVQHPPAAPHVSLRLAGEAQEVDFAWTGPSGEQFYQIFNGVSFKGQPLFKGYRDNFYPDGPQGIIDHYSPGGGSGENLESEWSAYAEPGMWTLTALNVCSFAQGCTPYTGTALAALFPLLTFHLTNETKPDIKPPELVAATVLTPSVSVSHGDAVEFLVSANDDVSGIEQSEVCASAPGPGLGTLCAAIELSEPLASGKLRLATIPIFNQTLGTYTINFIGVRDVARNPNQITDPAVISTLFGGHPTFTLTP